MDTLRLWWLRRKASVYNVGDLRSIPGLGSSLEEGNGNPLQYSCLENPMDGGAWCPWGCKELDTTERLHFFHSVTFIKRFFSSSLLSAIKAVSSAYLRLLIFLPTILIPACASSSPAFHMMYSAHKLNKHGDNTQSWHTLFQMWNYSVVPCPVMLLLDLHTDFSEGR